MSSVSGSRSGFSLACLGIRRRLWLHEWGRRAGGRGSRPFWTGLGAEVVSSGDLRLEPGASINRRTWLQSRFRQRSGNDATGSRVMSETNIIRRSTSVRPSLWATSAATLKARAVREMKDPLSRLRGRGRTPVDCDWPQSPPSRETRRASRQRHGLHRARGRHRRGAKQGRDARSR